MQFDRYELMLLRTAVENELWLQKEGRKIQEIEGHLTLIASFVLDERIQRLEAMHEKLSKFIAEIEQAEAQPIDLSSQRTKKAMHKLAESEPGVLEADLSNGLEPLSPSEDE